MWQENPGCPAPDQRHFSSLAQCKSRLKSSGMESEIIQLRPLTGNLLCQPNSIPSHKVCQIGLAGQFHPCVAVMIRLRLALRTQETSAAVLINRHCGVTQQTSFVPSTIRSRGSVEKLKKRCKENCEQEDGKVRDCGITVNLYLYLIFSGQPISPAWHRFCSLYLSSKSLIDGNP